MSKSIPFLTGQTQEKPIDLVVIIIIATLSFLFGVWGIHSHTFEGDDFFYFESTNFGRPVADIVFKFFQVIFGTNAAVYHISLILLHILSTSLSAYALYGITQNRDLTLVSSALFLVNVSHFRTLYWISCIGYPIALCLGMYSILMLKKARPLSSFFCLALGIASHPGIILFPLIGVLWRAYRTSLILLLSGLIIAYALTLLYPNAPQSTHLTMPDFAVAFKNLLWYLGRLTTSFAIVFPHMNEIKDVDVFLGVILFVFCLFISKNNVWALFVIVATLPFITNPIFNDWPAGPSRHLYFASFGICVLAGQLICHVKTTRRLITTLILACTLVICGYSLQRSRAQSAYLEGRGHVAHGDRSGGLQRYRFAIAHAPELLPEDVYFRASMIALYFGQVATPLLRNAPQTPTITMLQDVSALLGKNEKTLQQNLYKIKKSNDPQLTIRTAKALHNLAVFYFSQNQYKQAAVIANFGHRLDPNNKIAKRLYESAKDRISQP